MYMIHALDAAQIWTENGHDPFPQPKTIVWSVIEQLEDH